MPAAPGWRHQSTDSQGRCWVLLFSTGPLFTGATTG